MASRSLSTALSRPNLNKPNSDKLKPSETSFNEPGINGFKPDLSEGETQMARDSSQRLLSRLKLSQGSGQPQSVKMQIITGGGASHEGAESNKADKEGNKTQGGGETLEFPAAALRLLVGILGEMADGNSVTLVPKRAELTTQQAASFLNVSRPYLVRLLEAGTIPFHKAGTHRRVRFQDVLAYKAQKDKDRRGALEELATLSQELGMGY